MWKLLLQEVFGVGFLQETPLPAKISDATELYRGRLKDFSFDRIIVCASYEGEVMDSIKRLKYDRIREKAERFVPLVSQAMETLPLSEYIMTWVPIGLTRFLLRGFNQSEAVIRAYVDKKWGNRRKCLTRFLSWKHQARLDAPQRLRNAENSFRLTHWARRYLLGKSVILFDDVIPTGATANECAKLVKSAGAREVIGVFLARSES